MMVPVGDAALMPLPPHNVCTTCGWVAADRTSLRMHERSHPHTMDQSKPYKCLYCEYRSRDRANLRVHERMHTNEKPYACDEVRASRVDFARYLFSHLLFSSMLYGFNQIVSHYTVLLGAHTSSAAKRRDVPFFGLLFACFGLLSRHARALFCCIYSSFNILS